MRTTELINEKKVSINWEFVDISEYHDSNWAVWNVIGIDEDGIEYQASCQADATNPYDSFDLIEEIEII